VRYERSLAIANRHERLIELVRSGEFSSRNLAEKLEVSEQTIYRDIDSLKERGYAVRSVRQSKGWAYKLQGEPATAQRGKGS
jgi:DeoR/GlpR family transcriptional regulator of sugar metabolism